MQIGCLLSVVLLEHARNHARQRPQREQVGDDHQTVEEVGQLPDQLDLQGRTEDDEEQHDDL